MVLLYWCRLDRVAQVLHRLPLERRYSLDNGRDWRQPRSTDPLSNLSYLWEPTRNRYSSLWTNRPLLPYAKSLDPSLGHRRRFSPFEHRRTSLSSARSCSAVSSVAVARVLALDSNGYCCLVWPFVCYHADPSDASHARRKLNRERELLGLSERRSQYCRLALRRCAKKFDLFYWERVFIFLQIQKILLIKMSFLVYLRLYMRQYYCLTTCKRKERENLWSDLNEMVRMDD